MRLRRGDAASAVRTKGDWEMGSGRTAASRRRHFLRVGFVLVTMFAAGLVTAGVVAGAGPLAVLSSGETPTDPGTPSTGTTSTDPTSTESTNTESTATTTTDTTTSESTTTETTTSTTTDATPAWPDPTEPYLVKFAAGTSNDAQATVLAEAGAESRSYIRALRIHSVLLPGGDSLQRSLNVLEAASAVSRLEPDREREAGSTPDDPQYADQWSLPLIGWDNAFGSVNPGGSARVAILDTGIDGSHPDLDGNVVSGTSILDESDGLSDPNGHGTAMAGIVAAKTNNGTGVAGIGYAGVKVMPVVVLGADGTGQDSDIIEGVVYAADHGADVILMSFSNPGYSELLQEAIDYAWDEGAVLIAATGNDGSSSVTFPAGDGGVIGVSNTDQSDALNSSSNYGQEVFLGAPGTSIATTSPGGGFESITGTSASAAEVAGAAALVRAASGASNGVIVSRLAKNADAVGSREQTGNGRLNLDRALADTSTDSVKPAGANPVGSGGPFVGPYVAAARNWVLTFAGTGSGSVTIIPSTGTVNAPVSCGGTGTNAASQTVTSTCAPNISTSVNSALVTFNETATSGSTFAGWSGQVDLTYPGPPLACTGTNNPCGAVIGSGGTLSVTFNTAGATKLAFTSSALTGVYGQCLGPITVQTQNASNVATNVTTNTTVNLATDAAGAFHSNNTCTAAITSVSIPTGGNSASFYYRAGAVGDGTHQLTASATGLTSASQTQTVNARPLTIKADDQSKTYGNVFTFTGSEFGITVGTLAGSDAISSVTLVSTGAAAATSVSGSPYNITASNAVFSTGSAADYAITYANGSLTITKRLATWTTNDSSKTYGNADPVPLTTGSGSNFVAADGVGASYSRAAGETVAGGPYHIAATLTPAAVLGNYTITNDGADFAITKAPLTVTADNKSAQYSDPNPPLTATITDFKNGETLATSGVTGSPLCTTTRASSSPPSPPTYPITCGLGTLAASNYTFPAANFNSGTFTVTQEDARATYTGPGLVFTPPGGSSATIALKATIEDATAYMASDTNAGNISNATVDFREGGPAGTLLCSANIVLDSPADIKIGTASCNATLSSVGEHDAIGVFVKGYYVGQTTNIIVEVAQPDGNFITGGGYLDMSSSNGSLGASAGSKMNFGFNVKYNKGSKPQPQGRVNVIFRVGATTYQIKSTSIDMLSLGFAQTCQGPPSATCWGVSTFTSKANLTNLVTGSGGGGYSLVISLTDKGEPGKADSFSVQLRDNSNVLVFSSNWSGSATSEKVLSGGNLVVH
jgi:hypothetical protein